MSFWYLATPYTNHPDHLDAAHAVACKNAALLLDAGIDVYSPIAHTHPIARYVTKAHAKDHEFWQKVDRPMMEAAQGLIFVKVISWEQSAGMFKELVAFLQAGKPIVFMEDGVVPSEEDFYRAENRYKPDYRQLTPPPSIVPPPFHPPFHPAPNPADAWLGQWPNPLMPIGITGGIHHTVPCEVSSDLSYMLHNKGLGEQAYQHGTVTAPDDCPF